MSAFHGSAWGVFLYGAIEPELRLAQMWHEKSRVHSTKAGVILYNNGISGILISAHN